MLERLQDIALKVFISSFLRGEQQIGHIANNQALLVKIIKDLKEEYKSLLRILMSSGVSVKTQCVILDILMINKQYLRLNQIIIADGVNKILKIKALTILIQLEEYEHILKIITSAKGDLLVRNNAVEILIEKNQFWSFPRVISTKNINMQLKIRAFTALKRDQHYWAFPKIIAAKNVDDIFKKQALGALINAKEHDLLFKVVIETRYNDYFRSIALKELIDQKYCLRKILKENNNHLSILAIDALRSAKKYAAIREVFISPVVSDRVKRIALRQLIEADQYHSLQSISQSQDVSHGVKQKILKSMYMSELSAAASIVEAEYNFWSLYRFLETEDWGLRKTISVNILMRSALSYGSSFIETPYSFAVNSVIQAWSVIPEDHQDNLLCSLIYKPLADYVSTPLACLDYKEISVGSGLIQSAYSFGILFGISRFNYFVVKLFATVPGVVPAGASADFFNKAITLGAFVHVLADSVLSWSESEETQLSGESPCPDEFVVNNTMFQT